MPSTIRLGERGVRPDFIIGDRFGTSASRDLCQAAIYLLQAQGFVVAHNKPYAGGFITEHYGRPSRGLHAIQIEVNRGLYLDEQNFQKSSGFGSLKQTIDLFLEEFAAMIDTAALKPPLAAE